MFDKVWLKDTAERAFWTFVEAFIVQLLLQVFTEWFLPTLRAAAISALAAALAVIKSAIAAKRSGTISPASTAKAPTNVITVDLVP